MPNTLVVSTFGCPFSEFEAMVKKVDKEQGYVFCSELEIIKVNEHKAMILTFEIQIKGDGRFPKM